MVRRGFIRNSTDYRKYRSSLIFEPKQKKRISFSFKKLKYFLCIAIFFYLIYFVFYSQRFYIKDVFIEGNNILSKDIILNEVSRANIFRLNVAALRAKLINRFPEIREVEIYRGIPNALKIVVNERDGRIVWQTEDRKYLVSSQGEVMRQIVAGEGDNLPVVLDKKNLPIKTGEGLVSPNLIAFIVNIDAGLLSDVNLKPNHFEVNETTFDLNLYTDAGFYIKLNSLRSSKKQLDNLKLVMVEKRPDIHEYVDVRIDGWAYYK